MTERMATASAGDTDATPVGRCHDLSETPPYGPWREALPAYRATDGLPAPPVALLPAATDASAAAVGSQEALFGQLRGFCIAVAAPRPLRFGPS